MLKIVLVESRGPLYSGALKFFFFFNFQFKLLKVGF